MRTTSAGIGFQGLVMDEAASIPADVWHYVLRPTIAQTLGWAVFVMSRLSDISASPTLREYAQGAAQDAIMPVADFLAPTVEVATSTGRFKKYDEKHRFRIPNTLRSLGGRAAELRFEVSDATYNCEPHALDYPVDNLEQLEAEGWRTCCARAHGGGRGGGAGA
jgi:hypothetical protein